MRRLLLPFVLLASLSLHAAEATPPPLTDVEALRVQNVNLERVIVQRALDDWQKKVLALKADLETARQNKWDWNPETGQWTAKPDSHAKVP